MQVLSNFFKFSERNTDLSTEIRAGLTTFLTMAYILFVNPMILKAAGIPPDACMVATAVAAGISSILMGLFANFPLALASGMGLNSMLVYIVVKGGYSWQVGMGLVFLDGLAVLLLVLLGVRETVMNSIPAEIKHAIAAGIGLFLTFIGFFNAGFTAVNPISMQPEAATLNTAGTLVAGLGMIIISVLVTLRIKGGILIGIILNTILALAFGVAKLPEHFFAAPDFSLIGALDIPGALKPSLIGFFISFIIVDFFDTLGSATAVGYQAGLAGKEGKIEGIGKILGIDAIAASIGGFCGASSVTAYIESAAGVSEGGRTGMTAITTGVFFFLSVFFAPIALVVPKEATAPALIIIGFMMMEGYSNIKFNEFETAIPAFLTMITMPFTYSISHGVGYGIISHVLLKMAAGKSREVHPVMYASAAVFIISFALL
ncbi:MAG: putative permease YicO [bacterium ADurb.Bin243]|nr:MAG: putative permease YicO [bacterium ADurb.Bin243]